MDTELETILVSLHRSLRYLAVAEQRRQGLDFVDPSDALSEGICAVVQAYRAGTHDPAKGRAFTSYAIDMARYAIRSHYLLEKHRLSMSAQTAYVLSCVRQRLFQNAAETLRETADALHITERRTHGLSLVPAVYMGTKEILSPNGEEYECRTKDTVPPLQEEQAFVAQVLEWVTTKFSERHKAILVAKMEGYRFSEMDALLGYGLTQARYGQIFEDVRRYLKRRLIREGVSA